MIVPFPRSRRGAAGGGPRKISAEQASDEEDYEEQGKRRLACRLDEDDRMHEQFRQQRAQMIAYSSARQLDGGAHAELELGRYEDQGPVRETELHRLH